MHRLQKLKNPENKEYEKKKPKSIKIKLLRTGDKEKSLKNT
jgi:hypothetical protein